MSANRDMIEAFVNGQLSEADHDLMAHHISTCQQCAASVAAERAVRAEMAKRPGDTAPVAADFDVLPLPTVDPVDVNVPAVPELQLDFVLDRTSDGPAATLEREAVREVALDQLPPAPSHSERRPHRDEDQRSGSVHRNGEPESGDTAVTYVDDLEIAEATAAGIADSVAHGAAELARTVLPEPSPVESEPVIEEPAPLPVELSEIIEESEPIAIATATEESLVEPVAPDVQTGPDYVDQSAAVEELPEGTEESVPLDAHPEPEVIGAADSGTHRDKLWRWSAAAGLLAVAGFAAYAAIQVRSSDVANAAAAPDQSEAVSDSDLASRTLPSVLTPILDSAVYGRVLDVTSATDSLANSLDALAYDPFAGDTVAAGGVTVGRPTQARPRRRAAERLPQIVSDPPDSDAAPVRQSAGERLPEVVTRNAPARTTARGGAVVISGVPDVPRLLRTTTHRPRSDIAYVLREYDASAAEPAPRAGVNEFRWKDATGSRLYVLSGPVNVTELQAYARRLQTQLP